MPSSLFAYEDAGRIDGWATAGRAWWHHDPGQGMVTIAVDPERRGRRIASALADADAHLAALGIRTTRTESLDEPAARALAGKWGFTAIGASSTSAVDPRTVDPLPVPDGVEIVPFAELTDPEPVYQLDIETSADIPNETFEAIPFEEWVREYWRAPDHRQRCEPDGNRRRRARRCDDGPRRLPSGRAHNNLTGRCDRTAAAASPRS